MCLVAPVGLVRCCMQRARGISGSGGPCHDGPAVAALPLLTGGLIAERAHTRELKLSWCNKRETDFWSGPNLCTFQNERQKHTHPPSFTVSPQAIHASPVNQPMQSDKKVTSAPHTVLLQICPLLANKVGPAPQHVPKPACPASRPTCTPRPPLPTNSDRVHTRHHLQLPPKVLDYLLCL